MSDFVNLKIKNDIAIVYVDNPPVNALSQMVRAGLKSAFCQAQEADISAVILICSGRTFFAGADIREFGKPPVSPELSDVRRQIENCRVPVIAAIHGTALGGGLEMAMACHYRIAIATARLGLPEVKLGLIPGAGGTQLAPRLMGVEAALDGIGHHAYAVPEDAHCSGVVLGINEATAIHVAEAGDVALHRVA